MRDGQTPTMMRIHSHFLIFSDACSDRSFGSKVVCCVRWTYQTRGSVGPLSCIDRVCSCIRCRHLAYVLLELERTRAKGHPEKSKFILMQIRIADDFIFPIPIGSPARDTPLELGSSSSDSTLTHIANLQLVRASHSSEGLPPVVPTQSSLLSLPKVIGCQSSDPTQFRLPIAIPGRLLPFIEQTIVGKGACPRPSPPPSHSPSRSCARKEPVDSCIMSEHEFASPVDIDGKSFQSMLSLC